LIDGKSVNPMGVKSMRLIVACLEESIEILGDLKLIPELMRFSWGV